MPKNKGAMPSDEKVDLKLRCGRVVRDTEPRLWRWKPWPTGESEGDIVQWQPAGALKRWEGAKRG